MGAIKIDEALRKGKLQLMWIPLIMMLGLIFLSILTFNLDLFSGSLVVGIALLVSAFILPWLWWSIKVVKWKIWAFGNVDDMKTLERRAIAAQLIWPHGSWFEKTEIKSKDERKVLEWLYEKMESLEPIRERVFDDSLPEETTIHYPIWITFVYVGVVLVGIYLLSVDNLLYGILGVAIGVYQIFESIKKQIRFKFLMKINSKGVSLPDVFIPWREIDEYFIEKSGYGNSIKYALIISGENFYRKIDLQDANKGAFKIESYLDVYRTRYEVKSKT